MKKSLLVALLGVALVCPGTVTQAAEGANDKPAQTPKPDGKQKQMPFRGKVSAVDKTAKTITLEGKEKGRTYQITSTSKITKSGKPAMLDDVVVGQSVGGLAKEAAGKWEVATLSIGASAGNAKDAEKKAEHK
jgi:hypothetical protein